MPAYNAGDGNDIPNFGGDIEVEASGFFRATGSFNDFDVEDEEPYYCEKRGEQTVLLDAEYHEPSAGYHQSDYGTDRDSQPQMYLHPCGDGEVLYLSLGHCSGKHDMKPLVDLNKVVRGSWNSPTYYELLRRGIVWGTQSA